MASFSAQRAPNSLLSTLLDTLKYNLTQKYWSYKNFLITIRSSAVLVTVSFTAVVFQGIICQQLLLACSCQCHICFIFRDYLPTAAARLQLSVPHLFYFQGLSANSCCSLAAVSATSVLFSGIICRLLCWWQLRSQLPVPHLFLFQGLSADCCVGGSYARSCQCHSSLHADPWSSLPGTELQFLNHLCQRNMKHFNFVCFLLS